ncbi:uncharacterized protein LOC132718848 [Ruditapes philippinarum]|uniref:uncharacterized protein LOC132718848 n=1 Tax=Ruditapes philippinarum TaxID=129788 RepID=UPI00295B0F54|nr:uncharacterized protein LOC132718848 [Ruditapes philippinarum]
MHRTNLVFLIPIVSKYLPTSEEAVYFFHTSPTYANNTIGFRSELWIDRYFKHNHLPVAVTFCIVCILVLFSKFAVKKFCKEMSSVSPSELSYMELQSGVHLNKFYRREEHIRPAQKWRNNPKYCAALLRWSELLCLHSQLLLGNEMYECLCAQNNIDVVVPN